MERFVIGSRVRSRAGLDCPPFTGAILCFSQAVSGAGHELHPAADIQVDGEAEPIRDWLLSDLEPAGAVASELSGLVLSDAVRYATPGGEMHLQAVALCNAAPDLCEALAGLLESVAGFDCPLGSTLDMAREDARAALAKAGRVA